MICFNSTTVYPQDVRETFSACCDSSLLEKRNNRGGGGLLMCCTTCYIPGLLQHLIFISPTTVDIKTHTQPVAPGAVINDRLNFVNTADRI